MLVDSFDNTTWQSVAIALGFAVAVSWIVSQVVARLVRALFARATDEDRDVDFRSPIVRRPVRLVRATVFSLTFLVIVFPALNVAGIDSTLGVRPDVLAGWLFESGLRAILIGVLAYAIVRFVGMAVLRFEERAASGTGVGMLERAKRARTLGRLMHSAVAVFVFGIASLMILQQLRIDIFPVLTGAGIVGLAVGFGAQTLVKDVIGGFFLILEDQVRVGDVALINGTGGLVEAVNLRTIVLRDLKGVVHVFPNGGIDRLSNMTKDFSFFVLDVGVAYKEDTDIVSDVLREVGAGMQADATFGPNILAPLEILGVEDFGDSEVTIRMRIKTVPLQQWNIGREFRRRMKKAFDARGIEIPFPHRSIYFGEASRPWAFRQVAGDADRLAGDQAVS